ncbi:hypothetical protein Avbf_00241 [Armadillidium vulgare]|nr:hypothetical protein Avbf_00241 [Armadillidium vulgare]
MLQEKNFFFQDNISPSSDSDKEMKSFICNIKHWRGKKSLLQCQRRKAKKKDDRKRKGKCRSGYRRIERVRISPALVEGLEHISPYSPLYSFSSSGRENEGGSWLTSAIPRALHQHRNHDRVQCSVCGKEVVAKKLKRHYRIHTGEKPYQCPHCPHRANRKENLEDHIRRKHGFPPLSVSRLNPSDSF